MTFQNCHKFCAQHEQKSMRWTVVYEWELGVDWVLATLDRTLRLVLREAVLGTAEVCLVLSKLICGRPLVEAGATAFVWRAFVMNGLRWAVWVLGVPVLVPFVLPLAEFAVRIRLDFVCADVILGITAFSFVAITSNGSKRPNCIIFVWMSLLNAFQALHLVAIATRWTRRVSTFLVSLFMKSTYTSSGHLSLPFGSSSVLTTLVNSEYVKHASSTGKFSAASSKNTSTLLISHTLPPCNDWNLYLEKFHNSNGKNN